MATDPKRRRLKSESVPDTISTLRKPVRFVVAGLGRAGGFHLQSIRLLGDHVAQLAYAIDVDEDRARNIAEEFHCKHATTLDVAAADPSVDAVIVCSTTNTHYELCKKALTANKAVFTEKPISHHPDEVADIINLAKSNKIPFIVGYQRRCDKNFRALRDLICEKKAIGGLRVLRCTSRDNPLPPISYLRTSGGIFHDMLSHDFDMMHFLTRGEIPDEVFSIGHCYNDEIRAMGDADTVIVTLKFKSGLLATVDTSRVAAYGYDQRVEAFGELGMLTAHNEVVNTVELANAAGHLKPCSEWSFPQRYMHTYTVELAEFCVMVRSNPMLVEEDALLDRHIELEKVAAAAELSLSLGRCIKLSDVDGLRSELKH